MKICIVEGCNVNRSSFGYCRNHYHLLKKYGKIPERTIYDPNDIIIKETFAEVILRKRNGDYYDKVIIDLDDIEIIKKHKWCRTHMASKDGYACSRINGKIVQMHRFIMGSNNGLEIDHINRNGLDNRKENLRFVTHSQNMMNTKSKGYQKKYNNYMVRLMIDGKQINVCGVKTEEEAKRIRKELEIKHFGEYRRK